MLKIKELQKQQHEASTRVSAAKLRVQSDLTQLELPSTMRLKFPNGPDDLMNFVLCFEPEGLYYGAHLTFKFSVPTGYPIDPPKVTLQERLFHPNISPDGALCLNILREDWKPVLSLNHIAMGIQFLFIEPNATDPLNQEAANVLRADKHEFELVVRRTMFGEPVNGILYDRVI